MNATARTAGAAYLLMFVAAVVAQQTVATHRDVSYAAYLLVVVFYVVVTAFFHLLFEPVHRGLSLLAALFSLVGCAIQAAICVLLRVPPQFDPAALKLYAQAFSIPLVFFGVYCFLLGLLIWKSTFLPTPLGMLMMMAGVSWSTFLAPRLATALQPYILMPGILAELSLTLWLLAKGVKER